MFRCTRRVIVELLHENSNQYIYTSNDAATYIPHFKIQKHKKASEDLLKYNHIHTNSITAIHS